MRKRWRVLLLALAVLTANVVFGAPDDRFKGGINNGYNKNSVLDASVPASGPRIKINGVPYERISSIAGDNNNNSIINGVRLY